MRRAPWVLVLGPALSVLHSGCSAPTKPPPPPSGGQTLVLSQQEFEQSVEPILVRQGCDATGDCHGGGIRGTLELSPPSAKDAQFDFQQVSRQVQPDSLEGSRILTAPLAVSAGGTPHGVKPFATTSDSDYVSILQWLRDGVVR